MRRLLLISLLALAAVSPPHKVKEIVSAAVDLMIECGVPEAEWRRYVLAMIHKTPAPKEVALAVATQLSGTARVTIIADALVNSPEDAGLIRALANSGGDWTMDATFGPITFERGPVIREAWRERPASELAEAAALQISALVNLGRAADAVAVFEALPEASRKTLLRRKDTDDNFPHNVQIDLAVSAGVVHRPDLARRFLAAAPDHGGMPMLVRALIAPNDEDPYDVLAKSMYHNGVWAEAAGRVADRGGYQRFAAVLRDSAGHAGYARDTTDFALPLLPSALRSELQATMQRDSRDRAALRARTRVASDNGILSLLRDAPRKTFEERPLVETSLDVARAVDCHTWNGPWPQYALHRCEARGQERLALAVSSELDPYNFIAPGAWWLYHSNDAGSTWEKVYTGVREMQPYSLVKESRIPMLGDVDIRIEADVHERASWYVKPRRRVLIVFSLPELRLDTDGDGVPDLVEERIVTDPHTRDTDGDGIDDGTDPLPHVASSRSSGSAEEEVLAMVLNRFSGGGTGFFIGDRSLLAGSGVKGRLVVLTRDEADVYRAKFGMTAFGDLSFLLVRRDGKKATFYVDSATSGSTYEFEKIDGVWVMHDRGGWVS